MEKNQHENDELDVNEGEEGFPNPLDHDEPSYDERMDDLERENLERKGEIPLPYQTWSFWLSLLATVLAFVAVSGVLPPDGQAIQWVVLALAVLGHFGYGVVSKAFLRAGVKNDPVNPAYKKLSFWGSLTAVTCSYLLGAGLGQETEVMQIVGMVIIGLGYFGFNTRAWIKRKGMVSPVDGPEFIMRLLTLIMGFSRKSESDGK